MGNGEKLENNTAGCLPADGDVEKDAAASLLDVVGRRHGWLESRNQDFKRSWYKSKLYVN